MKRIIISIYIFCLAGTALFAQEGILEKFIQKPEVDTVERLRLEYEFNLSGGAKQKMLGNVQEAKKFYARCIELRPERPAPYYELSSLSYVDGEVETARGYIEQAVSLDPKNEWYKFLAIEIATRQEKYLDGARYYRELFLQFPQHSEYLSGEIDLLASAGEHKEALKRLEEMEQQFGFSKYTAIRKKEIYLATGKTKQAYKELEKLIEEYPGEVDIMGILAELYAENGEEAKALALFERMKALNSGNPLVYFSLGQYLLDLGRTEEALAEFQKGFASRDVNPEIKIQIFLELIRAQGENEELNPVMASLLEVLYNTDKGNPSVDIMYADYMFNQGKEDEAEIIYRRITTDTPSNFLAWQNLLFIQSNQQDFEEMFAVASEAVLNFPNQPLFLLFKGIGAGQTERFELAIKALNSGLGINVNNIELTRQFYISLGDTYYQMDNFEEAFKSFDNLLALDPDNVLVLNNYSYYLSVLGRDLDKALLMIEKCIKMEKDNPTYLDTYAWVLFKLERYPEALDVIEKVMVLSDKPSGEVLEHYGDILFRNNKKDKAVDAWKKAAEAGGASEEIKGKIEKGL